MGQFLDISLVGIRTCVYLVVSADSDATVEEDEEAVVFSSSLFNSKVAADKKVGHED